VKCKKRYSQLIHNYLDGDLTKKDEIILRNHLEGCKTCQAHFHELNRTITLIQSTEQHKAPNGFVKDVMEKLPAEKRYFKLIRTIKRHPILAIATILFLVLSSTIFFIWNQDSELIVSKQEDLEIKGDMVIVPEGVVIDGDLYVKNGDLKIDGIVKGDVTLVNGNLIMEDDHNNIHEEDLLVTVEEVNGEFYHLNQMFAWIWYHIKSLLESIFVLGIII